MKHALICLLLAASTAAAAQAPLPYTIVATGQTKSYDNRGAIAPPKPGQPFYGQDAQFQHHPSSYALSPDGLSVHDNNTDLTWQRSPDTDGDGALTGRDKLTWAQAKALPAKLNAARFGGFSDWRLPSIKELYSLITFSGIDPSGPSADAARLAPFIDTRFFKFAYGSASDADRIIDSQYVSSTRCVAQSFRGVDKVFGVNFADGRIKGYDLLLPGGGREKTFFVLCVRGNPRYGSNDFRDNGDGTITDRATGLTWAQGDSGKGLAWEAALAWVQARNLENYLGHNDWRLPSAKELQSIVDYGRSPDTSASPAIDPLFRCTALVNEVGEGDYPYYWTSTTHTSLMGGSAAVYLAFGRAAGWPSGPSGSGAGAGGAQPSRGGPGSGGGLETGGPRRGPETGPPGASSTPRYVDVHGAGSQRSDPKTGDASAFPHGRGPQGDVIRINNYVRCVRGG